MRALSLLLLLVGACAGTSRPTPDDDGGLDTTPTDLPPDSDTATEEHTDAFEVTFDTTRYKVEQLAVMAAGRNAPDLDGDGVGDNEMGAVLDELGKSFPGIALDDVNARIEHLLLDERAVVLMEARHDGKRGLVLDVVLGERRYDGYVGLPSSYSPTGVPTQRLLGRFTSPTTAVTSSGELSLPLQFYPEDPVIFIHGTGVHGAYDINPAVLEGRLGASFPIDDVMDHVVDPLLLAYFGSDDAPKWSSVARALLKIRADQHGGTALSGAFSFSARVAAWDDPLPAPLP